MNTKIISIILGTLTMVISFQNCGKVELKSSNSVMLENSKTGTGFLCLPSGFTLDTFFISNLNVKSTSMGLESDIDGDGLSDREEAQLGFNPEKRRTSGKVLDSICSTIDYGVNCTNFTLDCNLSQNAFGLNECDILALNLNRNVQLGTGIDSDKDGIPDYLEIRINSFPNLYDSYNDLDFDQLNTTVEAERGTSVRNSSITSPDQNYIKVVKTKMTSQDCAGEYWKVDILNLPTMPIKKFTEESPGVVNLSHQLNENIIMTFLKIKPIGDLTAPTRIFSGIQKVKYDQSNVDTAFILDQKNLYFTGEVDQ